MKKIHTTLVAVFAIVQLSYGQLTGTSLNINNASTVAPVVLSNTGVNTGLEIATDNNSASILSYDRTAGAYKGMSFRGNSFAFSPFDVTKFLITGSGYVGIGTANPQEALDVNGNPVFGTSTERLSIGSESLGFNRKVANGNIYNSGIFAYQFQHTGNGTASSDNLALQVYAPNGGNVTPFALTVNGSAQVGINTAYVPAGYQFAVNGSLISTSVTVKNRGNWPDYVFTPHYFLPSLLEVKSYINKNQHLADMPSAAEIAKSGINLGEIVKIQTKKIEELTLYAIREAEDNAQLRKEQEKQAAKIEEINQKLQMLMKVLNQK